MMDEKSQHHSGRYIGPLWVIGSFVGLAEVLAGVTILNTTGNVQLMLVLYMASFSFFVSGLFFVVLWKKNHVLFGPREYIGTDILKFVTASQGDQSVKLEAIDGLVAEIKTALNLEDVQTEIKSLSLQDSEVAAGKVANIVQSVGEKSKQKIFSASVTISFPCIESLVDNIITDHAAYDTVQALMDDVWRHCFSSGIHLPPYRYGECWVLRNSATGSVVDRGLINSSRDDRTLVEAGICPGDKFVFVLI